MEIKIIAFGQIAQIIGKEIYVKATDVVSLKITLQNHFPALAEVKYAMAINKKLVKGNINLTQNDTVALMPPYSGG